MRCSFFTRRNCQVIIVFFIFLGPVSSFSNCFDCTMQHFTAAAALLTRLRQLPWLALMMHSAATCPIFRPQIMHNHRLPHEWLGIRRPFLSALEISMWLRDGRVGTRRTFERRSRRLQLLCFMQFGVVAARLCSVEQNFDFRVIYVSMIRRCLSARGVDLLLNRHSMGWSFARARFDC